jgi:acyl-CoA synthetase (AMP-forming)/AMP-acid ligase II
LTVYEEFLASAGKYGQRPFLHIPRQATRGYSDAPVDFTYSQILERVDDMAERFRRSGYRPGHRIALVLENRAEFFLYFLALNGLGVSIVPVNAAFSSDEMRYVIDHSDSALAVSLPEHADRVAAAASGLDVPITEVGNALPPAHDRPLNRDHSPDDRTEVALLYTSGTTGRPKGCMLSNEYFLCMGNWYRSLGGYCALEPGRERLLTPLPLVHMNALACSTMGMIMTGGCVIQLDRFHASSWWEAVGESRATCLHYLGVMPAILLNLPASPDDDFGDQIKFGFGAGADPRHQQRFEQRFGFPLIEGWAMTETGTEVCICAHKEPRHVGQRCIGRPTGAIDYKLVDEEGGEVPKGEPGELLIRVKGRNPRRGFFSGYYKDRQATDEAWAGGYFHTGDVVRVGKDGSFYFVDRRKNIIRRSGENVAAVEVEGVLYQHDAVANCVVAPVSDEIRGEEVSALVVLADNHQPGPELAKDIFAFCSERLAYYKNPGYIAFVASLPMTSSQKIQRGEVKKLAAAMVEKGDCVDLRDLKRMDSPA